MIGSRGGFEIGTQILQMPRLHARRFRQFITKFTDGGGEAYVARPRKPKAALNPLG